MPISFEPEAPQINFEPIRIDFTPEALPADAARVAQMAGATRAAVSVVGRAIAATDIAQAGADAPETGRIELEQPDESSLTNQQVAPLGARRQPVAPVEASKLLEPMFGRFPRVSAQEVSDALSMLASGSPDLTEEEAQTVIENTVKPGNLEKIIAGAQRAAINIPEAATTPLGVATLGAGALPATAGRIVSGGFAVDMARHIPGQVQELRRAVLSGDSERITEASGNLLATGLMTAGATVHAARPTVTQVAPQTAEAVAKTTTAPLQEARPISESSTPLTTAALESVKGPVLQTPAPTPAAAASESVRAPSGAPLDTGEVAPSTTTAKIESERALTATGIKNAAVDAERAARGAPPIMTETRISNPQTWEAAMARIEREPGWQDRLVDELKEKPRTPSAEEVVGLDHRYVDLQNEYTKATEAGKRAFETGDSVAVEEAKSQSAFYEGKLAELEDVARKVGAEWGRSGQMRSRLLREDFTLAAMEARARADKGFQPLTEAEHTQIAELQAKIQAADARAEIAEARKAFAEAQAKAASAYEPRVLAAAERFAAFMDQKGAEALGRLKERLKRTSAGIDPTILSDVAILGAAKITRGAVDFAKWTEEMTADLGEWFREHAKDAWDASQKHLTGRISAISSRDVARAKADAALARDEFGRMRQKLKSEQASTAEKVWTGTKEGLNLSRALLTSYDLSGLLRQGGFVAFGNPVRAAKAIGPMFEAAISERRAAIIEQEMLARPNATSGRYAAADLFIAPRDTAKLTGMEEAFMSRLAKRIPGVSASQRAYITVLNKLRTDTFDALYESLSKRGEVTLEEMKAIANYVNVATGRGNLGKAAAAAETLATVFFSPRLVASRFQLIAGQPFYRGTPRTRYLVAKEYSKFLMGIATVYGLGQLAGATVETNPRSSDFGKLKFGNTRVDPLGGLSQTTVLVSRLATGEKTNLKGVTEPIRGKVPYGKATSADVIANFLRTKLSPLAGSAVDIATGKNVVGEPVTPTSVAVNAVVPLSFRDILEVMEEQGVPRGTAIGILSLFGMGVQNYDAQKAK